MLVGTTVRPMKYLFILLAMVSQVALAQDEESKAPEFLLGDIGVQVNLNKRNWTMNRWSDWDFKATSKDNVLVYAWATPLQVDVTEANVEQWAVVHTAKAKEEGGGETKVVSSEFSTLQERPTAKISLEVAIEGGDPLAMHGISTTMKGQTFHLATVAANNRSTNAQRALNGILEELDFKVTPEPLNWGGTFESEVSKADLSDTWRAPMKSEMQNVMALAKAVTVRSFLGCWSAIHPVIGDAPDLVVTCQDPTQIGILDSYTFDDVSTDLKNAWFGSKTEATPEMLELDDGRVGILFSATVAGQSVNILGLPNEGGLAKTIVAGKGKSGVDLGVEIRAIAAASSVSAPVPLEFRDLGLYYLKYQPWHPYVLVPILLALITFFLIIAMIVIGARRQPTYDDY